MIELYVFIIVITFILLLIAKHEPKEQPPVIYANGWEKHDLETWRQRGMETAKNKNDKSIIRHAQGQELLGALFIIHNWDLKQCK